MTCCHSLYLADHQLSQEPCVVNFTDLCSCRHDIRAAVFLCSLAYRLPTQAGWVGCESSVLTLHDQWEMASFNCMLWQVFFMCHVVQVLHMQTLGGPSSTGGLEPQPGWMALYPESRYMLTLAPAAVRLAWPQPQPEAFAAYASVFVFMPCSKSCWRLTCILVSI